MTFTLHNGKYQLKKILFKRTQMTGNPENIDYYSLEIEKYIEADNIFFPAQFISESKVPKGKFTGKNGGVEVSPGFHRLSRFNITDIKVNNAVETISRNLQTQIPNGTVIHLMDVPQIKYVWFDGKIVPWTDDMALESIRNQKFIINVREPRFWFISLGIILIVLGIGWKILGYLQERKKK
ncbi:MAG: hypothetical protein LBE18_06605 [Planctomycetaceae bacterium]|jgi:hypothetical protein|nr:hypothetical protein [Planctomycetaceae bacterium]